MSAAAPQIRYDSSLPITGHREDIIEAIQACQVLIIAGETGSGKTTQIPKMCLDAGRGGEGLIGCTQPRRIAASSMAARVAEELGQPARRLFDGLVGYKVRFRDRTTPNSRIRFMTDGILLSELAHDPGLRQYDTIIIDEAHERSLNIDFLLGCLKQLLPRRPDLRLIITSATIDTEKFSRHFDDAPVIEVSGRSYPVDIVYRPLDADSTKSEQSDRDLYKAIGEALKCLDRIDSRGDVLVFLSGEREIREAGAFLARQNPRHTEVLPLFARLSAAEQHRVFHPGPQRRVILCTNIAETSLTVPRIRFVIDSGLARISRYSHRSRIQRLPIEAISRASANQRAGRCGRLGPGTCVRLYSEEDFDLRPEFTEPEILRTSLANVILQMLCMGLGAVQDFPFVDPPAPKMINDAYNLLQELGAIGEDRMPSALGRRLARWPMDVRLGRMVLEADRLKCVEEVLVLASALSIQDPRERPLEMQQAADESHGRFGDQKSDFAGLLRLWHYLRDRHRKLSGNQFRKLCRREFFNWQRVLEWFDLHHQLRVQAREEGIKLGGPSRQNRGMDEKIHKALLSGLLSHVAMQIPESHAYLGPRSRQFHIFPGSGLFKHGPKWMMSAEIVETSRPYARGNAAIKPGWIEEQGRHLLKRHYFDRIAIERGFPVLLVEARRQGHGLGAGEPFWPGHRGKTPRSVRRQGSATGPGDFYPSCPGARGTQQPRAFSADQRTTSPGTGTPRTQAPPPRRAGGRKGPVRIFRCARAAGCQQRKGVRALVFGAGRFRARIARTRPGRPDARAGGRCAAEPLSRLAGSGRQAVSAFLPVRAGTRGGRRHRHRATRIPQHARPGKAQLARAGVAPRQGDRADQDSSATPAPGGDAGAAIRRRRAGRARGQEFNVPGRGIGFRTRPHHGP